MHEGGFFYQAFIYLAAAVISVPIAKKLGLGSVLGYLIAGVVIGPFGLHLIGLEGQDVMHFAEFGVVMMLFLIGLELQPTILWKMRGPILGLGGLQVLLSAILITGFGLLFGLSWKIALSIGMILSLSSTAFVLQTLNEKGLMKSEAGQNCFSVLLFQDIAVIPMLAILPLFAITELQTSVESVSNSSTMISELPVWGQTLAVLFVIAAIILVGKYLMSFLFRFIASSKLRETFTAAALLIIIGIALLMSQIGLSPALGAFIAGVVLAGNEYRHELEGDIEPFKGLLLGLFFISVGASIDFNLIADQPSLIFGLVISLVFIKMLVLFSLGKFYKMGYSNKMLFTFALAQGGEFAFVLFSFSVQNGIMDHSTANPLAVVVAISMALTPLLMILNEKVFLRKVNSKSAELESDVIEEKNPVIIAGFGKFGSIIGRFLRANGIETTVLETDPDKIEVLRKLGLKVFYGDASRIDLLHSAGAENASLFIITIEDEDKITEIVEITKKHFPKLKILVKAVNRKNAYDVIEKGIKDIYLEPMDSSLNIGIQALKMLGFRSHQAVRSANKFKKHETESVFELAKMKHNRKQYIQSAKQIIKDLEKMMLNEINYKNENKDLGWDTNTLRSEFGKTNTSDSEKPD